MSTYSTTVPQQREDLPAREVILNPFVGILLDAAETLNGHAGTDWMGEQCTARERDFLLLTTRYLCQLMIHGLGLWEPSQKGEADAD
jgi:hypothetical protein